jgi:hypothetical protein
VSFRYADRLTDPTEFQAEYASPPNRDLQSLAEKEAEAAAQGDKYVDPRILERQRRIERFTSSQEVTHIVLTLTPVAVSLDEVVPPAELAFDVACAKVLLQRHAPASWDEILADGKKSVLLKAARRLCSLVRLEYSDSGLQYSVIGAFAEPAYTSCAWPHDAPEYLNEDLDDLEEELEGSPLHLSSFQTPMRFDSPVLMDALNLIPSFQDAPASGWSEVPSAHTTEPPTPSVLTRQSTAVFADASAKLPPTPSRWKCPFHPAQSACSCLRQPVTLKGSELWVFASALSAPSRPVGTENEVSVPEDVSLSECGCISYAVHCANELRVRAVDRVDESLHCDVVIPASVLTSVLQQSIRHASKGDKAFNAADGDDRSVVTYHASSHNVIDLDLSQHPPLLRELVVQLFNSSHVDLFLSRKTRHIKLVVK